MSSLKRILETKALQLANSAEIAAQTSNDWQAIQAHLARRAGALELSPTQTEKLKRYEFAYNQLMGGRYVESEVADMLQEMFQIEAPQAYRDIRDAQEIFTTTLSVNKAFQIKQQLQLNQVYQRKAQAAGNMKALAAFEKNRYALLSMLPDESKAAGEDFVAHINEYVFDPSQLGITPIEDNDLQRLYKDLATKYGKEGIPAFEDAEFEMIPDGNQEAAL